MVPGAQLPSGAAVIRGFDAAAKVAEAIVERSRDHVLMLSAATVEEFLPAMFTDHRGLLARGGRVRLVCVGRPSAEALAELLNIGTEVRLLPESRELGLLASEGEVMLFPVDQRPESPLEVCVVLLTDPLAVAHLRLAFERAWDRARPVPATVRAGAAKGR